MLIIMLYAMEFSVQVLFRRRFGVLGLGSGLTYRSRHQIAICGGCDVYIGFKPR